MKSYLVAFDVCDTLFFSNTTFDYVQYIVQKEGNPKHIKQVANLRNKYSLTSILCFIRQKITGIDYAKAKVLAHLHGYSKEELYGLAKGFYDDFLVQKQISETISILEKAKSENKPIKLISASIDPIISVIAEIHNASFACSQLEYQNGFCIGKVAFEMKGHKANFIQKELENNSCEVTFISDNQSDKELLYIVDNAFVVIYNENSKKYWNGNKVFFIEPSSTISAMKKSKNL